MSLRRLVTVACVGVALAAGGALAQKPVPKDRPLPPGAPTLPKQPPPPDDTHYYKDCPLGQAGAECRTALAYLMESFTLQCRREALQGDRNRVKAHHNFEDMIIFVQSTERVERGKVVTMGPGDRRRALTMKAKFLMEDIPCEGR